MKNVDFAPAPQSTFTAFSKFRHHKEREKLQDNLPGVLFLNPTDTHVDDFDDGVLHTLAQLNIRVQACRVPGAAFAGGIFTEP